MTAERPGDWEGKLCIELVCNSSSLTKLSTVPQDCLLLGTWTQSACRLLFPASEASEDAGMLRGYKAEVAHLCHLTLLLLWSTRVAAWSPGRHLADGALSSLETQDELAVLLC